MRAGGNSGLLALGALAAASLGLVWLTGALSAALFGGGWTALGASELAIAAVGLPSHLGDPRLAWPAADREALPGAVGFYLVGAALLAAAGATAWGLLRAREVLPTIGKGGRSTQPASARWASGRDLGALRVEGPQPGRLVLGRHGRRLLAAEERQSVIVLAPAQSGKTTGLAIPALIEWQGPALVTSVKSDLLAATLGARRRLSDKTMVFDPVGATGRGNVKVSPLHGCKTWDGALRVANWLSSAARAGGENLSDADFWFKAAEKLLAPLLYAAATDGKTMGTVVDWLDAGPKARKEVTGILSPEKPTDEDEAALRAWEANWNRESRQRSSIYTTAETIVAAFADPKVRKATEAAEYTPTDLLDRRCGTLYLCAPAHEQQRLRPLFAMLVRELISVVYESSAATGKPIHPPLLLVLDELANIAPIPNLDEVASTGAGQGIQLLSIFQDMAQVKSRYGENAAQTIVNNHRAKLFGTGISDPETLDYVSHIVGSAEFEHRSETADDKGGATRTQGSIYRDLTPANVVREAKRGTGLLVYGHLPPARIRLRRPPERETVDARSLPTDLLGEAPDR